MICGRFSISWVDKLVLLSGYVQNLAVGTPFVFVTYLT